MVNLSDEQCQTLLHHAAYRLHPLGEHGAVLILFILLRAPGLNFYVQDKQGNTPLHVAAIRCTHQATDNIIYPAMKKAAE